MKLSIKIIAKDNNDDFLLGRHVNTSGYVLPNGEYLEQSDLDIIDTAQKLFLESIGHELEDARVLHHRPHIDPTKKESTVFVGGKVGEKKTDKRSFEDVVFLEREDLQTELFSTHDRDDVMHIMLMCNELDRSFTKKEAMLANFITKHASSHNIEIFPIIADSQNKIFTDFGNLPRCPAVPGETPIQSILKFFQDKMSKAPNVTMDGSFLTKNQDESVTEIYIFGKTKTCGGASGTFVPQEAIPKLFNEKHISDRITDMLATLTKKADDEDFIDPLDDVTNPFVKEDDDVLSFYDAVNRLEGNSPDAKHTYIIIGDEYSEDDDDPNTIATRMHQIQSRVLLEKKAEEFTLVKEGSVRATAGQILVNDILPPDLRDYNRVIDKKQLKKIFQGLADKHPEKYRDAGFDLKKLGDDEAVFTFDHVKYKDVFPVIDHKPILRQAEKDYQRLRKKLKNDDFAMIDAYGKAKERLSKAVADAGLKQGNAYAKMAVSGSRGSATQLTDMIQAPLLVSDFKNKPIPVIIDRSYAQGLTHPQYFATSYGTRRGMISTKLATPLAGHTSKMLSWTMNNVVVTEDDCGTTNGNSYSVDDMHNVGKLLAKTYGAFQRNMMIDENMLSDMKKKGIKKILVRSPLTCESSKGICKMCSGKNETGGLPPIGYNVGMNSAAAMSEPLSQGMLSEKHTGGAVKKRVGGYPLIKKLIEVPKKFPDKAVLSEEHGKVEDIRKLPWGGYAVKVNEKEYFTSQDNEPTVKKGDTVERGDILTMGTVNPAEYTSLNGTGQGRKQLSESLRNAFEEMGMGIDRSHFEIASRAFVNFGRVEGDRKIGQHFPGDVGFVDELNKSVRFSNLEKTPIDPNRPAFGKFLTKPMMHFTPGTELTPKVMKELHSNGFKEAIVSDKKAPIEPLMVRVQDTAATDKDWVTRLGSQGLKKSVLDAVHRGHTSSVSGPSFIHAYIKGVNFGRGKLY